ncbi:MAG: hypothetical protein ACKVS9_14045 [Phycisphaerae bacterium]
MHNNRSIDILGLDVLVRDRLKVTDLTAEQLVKRRARRVKQD